MKKITVASLILVFLLSFSGCSLHSGLPQETFSFSHGQTDIFLNADAAPVVEALGDAKRYSEKPSCAFDGMDKTYYYGSFYMTTYCSQGTDHIYSIWFADDSESTKEGIRIGSTKDQVESAYGENCFRGTNACKLTQGDSQLTIIIKDDIVSAIQYEALVA